MAPGAAVCASQSLTVLSQLPEAICWPLGENTTLITEEVWPLNVCVFSQVAVSYKLIVPSPRPTASVFPSGEYAHECTLETSSRNGHSPKSTSTICALLKSA